MAGAVKRLGGFSPEHEYERHRGAVLGMLGKRFPRFDDDERLAIYHDAWVRALAKRESGERIENLRAYLMATCSAEAMHAVSRSKAPTPVAPDEPLFTGLADESAPVEDQVVMRDQTRLARDLIASLDQRQRDVLKLRWDLQLDGSEVRAALGLTRRQYQRLTEEGAAAIAKRVEELEDGTWSRRQRSLLMACLVRASGNESPRRGIANARQRMEAQRLLESDPHFAALYAEVRGALDRGAVLLPLPVLFGSESAVPAGATGGFEDLRERLGDLIGAVKQHAIAAYVRTADPTVMTGGPRPGAAIAAVAGCVAIGGGALGTYEALSEPAPQARPSDRLAVQRQIAPTVIAPLPDRRAVEKTVRPAVPRRSEPSSPQREPAPLPEPADQPSALAPPPAPTAPPIPTPAPADNQEFSFEN